MHLEVIRSSRQVEFVRPSKSVHVIPAAALPTVRPRRGFNVSAICFLSGAVGHNENPVVARSNLRNLLQFNDQGVARTACENLERASVYFAGGENDRSANNRLH